MKALFDRRLPLAAVALGAAVSMLQPALAQVPPAKPGEICVVPNKLWCWANPPGRRGEACKCPSPYGPQTGTLR